LARASQNVPVSIPRIGGLTSFFWDTEFMQAKERKQRRQQLVELRRRIAGGVEFATSTLLDDLQPNTNISAAPVHLADAAPQAVDAEVEVLERERQVLMQIDAAIADIDEGKYGQCEQCGQAIPAKRLDALPYARFCAECELESRLRPE
jgi:RNA polymerase-binding protein DksA